MNPYVLMTDSSCDLPASVAEQYHLVVLPLTAIVDGKEYKNYLDEREISSQDFYALLRKKKHAETSAVNVYAFKEAMTPFLKEGKDILYLAFSSGLSNTCNAAKMAAQELAQEYPNQKVLVVDTLAASLGQGLLVTLAAREMEKGKSMEEVADWAEQTKLHLCHWFTVDDLDHLRRGGRVSAAKAKVGTLLRIKPVLHVDNDGHLIQRGMAKGRKASLKILVKKMEELADHPDGQLIYISHGDCLEEAEYVASMIRERWNVEDILINPVGPVIGAHSGPGTMALFFLGKER